MPTISVDGGLGANEGAERRDRDGCGTTITGDQQCARVAICIGRVARGDPDLSDQADADGPATCILQLPVDFVGKACAEIVYFHDQPGPLPVPAGGTQAPRVGLRTRIIRRHATRPGGVGSVAPGVSGEERR